MSANFKQTLTILGVAGIALAAGYYIGTGNQQADTSEPMAEAHTETLPAAHPLINNNPENSLNSSMASLFPQQTPSQQSAHPAVTATAATGNSMPPQS